MGEREFGEVLRFPGPKRHSPQYQAKLGGPWQRRGCMRVFHPPPHPIFSVSLS